MEWLHPSLVFRREPARTARPGGNPGAVIDPARERTGSLVQQVQTAPPARAQAPAATTPTVPVRPVIAPQDIRPAGTRPAATGGAPIPARRPGRAATTRTTSTASAAAANPRGTSTVARRVRQGLPLEPTGATAREAEEVREILARPSRASTSRGGGGGSGAQQALGRRDYSGCVSATNSGFRSGRLSAQDATARGYCLLELKRPIEAAEAFELAQLAARRNNGDVADAVYGASLAAIATNLTDQAALAATGAPLSRPRRTELQTGILTQRAVAANLAEQPIDTLYYLDQRNRIAPQQKDLMILQGYAYLNSGNTKAADRIFRAVDATDGTGTSRGAMLEALRRRYPSPNGTGGSPFR